MNKDETLEQLLGVFKPEDQLPRGMEILLMRQVLNLIQPPWNPYIALGGNGQARIVAVEDSKDRCKDIAIARGYHHAVIILKSEIKVNKIPDLSNIYKM